MSRTYYDTQKKKVLELFKNVNENINFPKKQDFQDDETRQLLLTSSLGTSTSSPHSYSYSPQGQGLISHWIQLLGSFFYLIRTGFRLGQLVSLVKVDPTFCNFLPY